MLGLPARCKLQSGQSIAIKIAMHSAATASAIIAAP
jgi:hypothetical protein